MKKPTLLSEFMTIASKTNYFEAMVDGNQLRKIEFQSNAKLLQQNIGTMAQRKASDMENGLKTFGNDDFDENENGYSLVEKYSAIRKRHRWTRSTPFGLIEPNEAANSLLWTSVAPEAADLSINLPATSRNFNVYYFVSEKQSSEYFYRIQRQRKIWWMRFAANPGRFRITIVQKDEANQKQSVSLLAKYPFGDLAVEHVELLPTIDRIPSAKENIPSKIIRTSTFLEVATIETVFDAIDAGDFGELCIHRRIAPFQCAIFCLASDEQLSGELGDLATYLSMLLRQSGIAVLNTTGQIATTQDELNSKYIEMDAIGVPYELTLAAESLQNGMMKLRNRDTSLCETVHISYLPHYLLKIFR